MLKKILLTVAALAGIAIGGSATWIFHYVLDANTSFITSHNVLVALVGTLGLLFFAHIVHDIKIQNPRTYGLLVLGIACGIFLQAIVYFKYPCPDDCHTDFVLKLGACVILMVDGFTSFYRKPAERSVEKLAE